jgi:hypothetical protein
MSFCFRRSEMREILFRGKREDTGEWAEGGILHYGEGAGEHAYIIIAAIIPQFVRVIPETVGEYTGLKDSAGKMIFEGDMVLWEGHGIIDNGEIQRAEIYFDENDLAYKASAGGGCEWFLSEIIDNIEVIGNIRDTPELLDRTP